MTTGTEEKTRTLPPAPAFDDVWRYEDDRESLPFSIRGDDTRPRRFARWQAALLYLFLIGLGIAIALPWGEVVWAWLGMRGGGR